MPSNDDAQSRFLFAILQQKCMKDVAKHPLLAQEITNGHAARMRYSRLRSAYLGIEPQRRNRKNADKSRVSKKKKDDKANKKDDARPSRDEDAGEGDSSINVKPDPNPEPSGDQTQTGIKLDEPSPRIKKEAFSQRFGVGGVGESRPQTPTSRPQTSLAYPSGPVGDMHYRSHLRMLTPCSDSDLVGFASSSAGPGSGDMVHSADSPYDFPASACAHDHQGSAWNVPSGGFSPFGGFDLDNYPAVYPCDHDLGVAEGTVAPADVMTAGLGSQYAHGLGQADAIAVSSAGLLTPEGGDMMVKHEEWDAQRYHQE